MFQASSGKRLDWENSENNIDRKYLNQLRFADDVYRISSYLMQLKSMLEQLNGASQQIDLNFHV